PSTHNDTENFRPPNSGGLVNFLAFRVPAKGLAACHPILGEAKGAAAAAPLKQLNERKHSMSGSLNKVILIGNLGRDPEIRRFQNGGRVASFSIATSESWKDKETGEKIERTEWHRISVLNDKLVEVIERYLKKGAKVYIEGQLETRKWTDRNA